MLLEQFYLASLGHASYLVGDEASGQALVWDPRRDVDVYLATARARDLRIAWVGDSHGHNDYLSGLSELAGRTGAEVWGAAAADLGYDHRPLRHGEIVELGDLVVEVLHTPGHTPEYTSLLVHDRAQGDEPALLLSGGSLLVGDVARPDLLGGEEEARQAAKVLCQTIQTRLLPLPDHVEVFPTHVAGSLCGGNIGSRLSTTLGYERRTNPVLARLESGTASPEACLDLEHLPAVPPYWRRMRRHNVAGVPRLGVLGEPPALGPEAFADRQARGAIVVDARSPEAFAGGHLPGALNVGLGTSFATWAGTVLPADVHVLLVLDDAGQLWEASWQLLRIGYEPPVGWLAGGMPAWRTAARAVELLPQVTVWDLAQRLDADEMRLLDVRQPSEWVDGHVDGAVFVTGGELPERLDAVPAGPLAVMCSSGFRSSVAASFLRHHGWTDVWNVIGGMSAWEQAGLPTVAD